jgi:hypothetical protein
MLSAIVTFVSLLLAVALVPVIGGLVFAAVFLGMFLLGLVGVLRGVENRAVRQRTPTMNPRSWQDGS